MSFAEIGIRQMVNNFLMAAAAQCRGRRAVALGTDVMFDTVILLSSALEREIFMTVLSTHNPGLTIIPVETLADLNALEPDTLGSARLLAFVTGVIVPADVLDHLGFGAYNFHPGPPAYAGFAPAHFALYDRASEFGATAHVMAARVDEGPIVGVKMFSIPPGASVVSLEGMAYARLCYLFWSLAAELATSSQPLARLPLSWSGKKTTRRDYVAMCGCSEGRTGPPH
jgi:methionyl-tRNA formyltransferase